MKTSLRFVGQGLKQWNLCNDALHAGKQSRLTITINIVLGLIGGVLIAVMASYTYVRYGMPKSFATTSVADSGSSGEPSAVPGFAGRTLDFHVG